MYVRVCESLVHAPPRSRRVASLQFQVPCAHGLAEPGSRAFQLIANRKLPCNSACEETSRAAAFAEAMFTDGGQPKHPCPYPDALLTHARDNPSIVTKVERQIRAMLSDPAALHVVLPPMSSGDRAFVHQLVEAYGLTSESFDREPKRYVTVYKRPPGSGAAAAAAAGGGRAGAGTGTGAGAGAGAAAAASTVAATTAAASAAGRDPMEAALDMTAAIAMPAVPLTDAVRLYAYRLPGGGAGAGGRRNPFGPDARLSSAPQRAHPSEPLLEEISSLSVGTKIHLTPLRASATERRLRQTLAEVLGDGQTDTEFL